VFSTAEAVDIRINILYKYQTSGTICRTQKQERYTFNDDESMNELTPSSPCSSKWSFYFSFSGYSFLSLCNSHLGGKPSELSEGRFSTYLLVSPFVSALQNIRLKITITFDTESLYNPQTK
jgi:hypothetical protein